MMTLPASVANGTACSVCWRSFGGGGCTAQTLDGVTRRLCDGCASLFFPVKLRPSSLPADLPPGYEHAQVVHLDPSDIIRASEEERLTRQMRGETDV